jgi:hypothetical protein
MSLHDDLLEQAAHLARWDPRKPRQASLRRAVSTAYYALFHLLVREASARLVTEPKLRIMIARVFDHGEMKRASAGFASGSLPPHIQEAAGTGVAVPPDLRLIAQAFSDLQVVRHLADYDLGRKWKRAESLKLVGQAERAFAAWERVRGQPIATVYLVALVLNKRRDR